MTAASDNNRQDPADRVSAQTNQAGEMLRSEEQLRTSTEVHVSGRAVLRKYVVTETITQVVEVRREEVRLDYEPASSDTAAAASDAAFDGRVIEVVLHREEPVVQMIVVPTERVRLYVDTHTAHVPVSVDLQQERVDVPRRDTANEPTELR